MTRKWWKEAVFYQIYPRSFNDSNGDGIGDLRGIIEKLDYIKDLGVDAIWLSPIYDSPNDDNGYDIRDYRKIMTEFGTMEDFDELLKGIHDRGMRLIMDLVVNHTSDEHEWFKDALSNPDSPYRKYYFFREGEKDKAPNNWTSFFSGPAWNYYDDRKLWALHLFSKKQMDLNWECDEMRADVVDMIKFWLKKGVDGFRMDVINYISKAEGLPDGD
ncbi:MAG: alpha-glucosidase, partial [Lachnospiraceae bacterium]|nr:alpha-glucosidase [Lachnospiraceae bacterium]